MVKCMLVIEVGRSQAYGVKSLVLCSLNECIPQGQTHFPADCMKVLAYSISFFAYGKFFENIGNDHLS